MNRRIRKKLEKAKEAALLREREAYIMRMRERFLSLANERDYHAQMNRILCAWIISLLGESGGAAVISKDKISAALTSGAEAKIDCDEKNYTITLK